MGRTRTGRRVAMGVVAVFLLLAAVRLFHRSPYAASALEVVPDAVEYAAGGYELATAGRYTIDVCGERLPPRYPPWFSLFVVAPVYVVASGEPGTPILAVLLFAVAGAAAAFRIGMQVTGSLWGAVLAAGAVLSLHNYRAYAGQVMTDVPTVCLLLVACAMYVRLRTRSVTPGSLLILAGSVVALAAAFRPLAGVALLPFLLRQVVAREPGWSSRLGMVAAPPALVGVATAAYNRITFGSMFRNGYIFWCPVPFEFTHLAFSLANVPSALSTLSALWVPQLAAGAALVSLDLPIRAFWSGSRRWWYTEPAFAALWEFVLLTGLPIAVFHLVYFFNDARLFLPVQVLVALVAAIGVSRWLRRIPEAGACVVALLILWQALGAAAWPPPQRRMVADRIREQTEPGAVVLSALDPVYFHLMVGRDSDRRMIPIGRDVEYASKLIAPQRLGRVEPPPRWSTEHRAPGLVAAGAREAVAFTADERPDIVRDLVHRGVPVYLDASFLRPQHAHAVKALQDTLVLRQVGEFLFRFVPRSEQ